MTDSARYFRALVLIGLLPLVSCNFVGGSPTSSSTGNSSPAPTTPLADPLVVGQANFGSDSANRGGSQPSDTSLSGPSDVKSDGTRFYVADQTNNRVLIWNSVPTSLDEPANIVLGQASMTTAAFGTSAVELNDPYGVFSDGTRLYVADLKNNRILIWNAIPATDSQAANIVVGQANMTANGNNTNAAGLWQPTSVFSDGTKLYVADLGNSRVLIWNSIPTANGLAANIVLGQPDMTSNDGSNCSATNMTYPSSVFGDGTRLYVADGNNRVLVWNSVPTVNDAPANVVLGEPNMASLFGGDTAALLNDPTGVFSDGKKVYVSDAGNSRVLIWDTIPTANGSAANQVIGQPNMTSNGINTGGVSASSLDVPWGLCLTPGGAVWIADQNNNRVLKP